MRRLAFVAVVVAALASSASAEASPEDIFGYGARTSAMGATGAAHARGYEAAFHDPALASTARSNQLTLGFTGGLFRLDASEVGRVPTKPVRGLVIGAAVPVPLGGFLTGRVGLAFGFYTPTDVIVRGRALYPERPQFPLLPDRTQSVAVRGALGVDVGKGVRLGLGFAALAEIEGTVVAATDATGRVGTRVEDQLVATYAPTLGATYERGTASGARYRAGLVYRGTLDARFAVIVDGTKLSSLTIPLFNISGIAQYDPAQLALEVARLEQERVVALQVVYKRWGQFPGLLEPTIVCADGGAGACGLTPPKIDWSDTFVVRVGLEERYALARGATFATRIGAFFETSPLPNVVRGAEAYDRAAAGVVTVPTRYYDADRLALTAGAGLSLGGPRPPIDVDFFVQYHALLPRTVRSSDGGGTTLAESKVTGHAAVAGLTVGVTF